MDFVGEWCYLCKWNMNIHKLVVMKKWIFILLASFCATLDMWAQEDVTTEITEKGDTLYLQAVDMNGQVRPHIMYPMHYAGWYGWDLHQGLNINVGLSAFTQFGKHARHGVGFSQNLSAIYATPLSEKLSLALGGYINNVNWDGDNYRSGGINAQLGYRFDEHWEAYLYAQKTLYNNMPHYNWYGYRGMYPMDMMMPYDAYMYNVDRIGAAVRYNFNPSFSIQLNVEHNWIPRYEFGSSRNFHSIPPPRP